MAACCWVKRPAVHGTPAEYCGAKVRYFWQADEEGIQRMKRRSFCYEHQAIVDAQDEEDED